VFPLNPEGSRRFRDRLTLSILDHADAIKR
jgi:hypothetical protein